MKQQSISSFFIFLLFLQCTYTFAQSPAAAPAQAPAVVVLESNYNFEELI
jgi:hypothetical protein